MKCPNCDIGIIDTIPNEDDGPTYYCRVCRVVSFPPRNWSLIQRILAIAAIPIALGITAYTFWDVFAVKEGLAFSPWHDTQLEWFAVICCISGTLLTAYFVLLALDKPPEQYDDEYAHRVLTHDQYSWLRLIAFPFSVICFISLLVWMGGGNFCGTNC